MYDSRLTYFMQTKNAQLISVNNELAILYKCRRRAQAELNELTADITRLCEISKHLQISMLEEQSKIIKYTDAGSIRKVRQSTKEISSSITPSDIGGFLKSLPPKERDIFVANLLSQIT